MREKIYIIISIVAGIFFSNNFAVLVNAQSDLETHDVKYYFDNIEAFNPNISRNGIEQEVAIRGLLTKVKAITLCKKAPCNQVKHFALQDINNTNYHIIIYEVNPLLQQLEIGKIYVLQGILEKDVDFGRQTVYISNFKPQKILE